MTGALSEGRRRHANGSESGLGGDPHGEAQSNELAQTLSALARSLEAQDDTDAMLDDLVAAAIAQIPGTDEASISLVRARREVISQSPSSDLPERVDALQAETGEGPCLDAVFTERLVRVPDMGSEPRWPRFASRAAEAGVGSMLSFQLWVDGDNLGALNLSSRQPHAFNEESEQIGFLFVSHAAIAMAGAQKYDQVVAGIATRDLIGQAKGILMERHSIDAHRAFTLLVRASQHSNRKLRDVAAELAATGEFGEIVSGRGAKSAQGARVLSQAQFLAEQLQSALETRATIEQAIGVLMNRTGGTEEEALVRLRELSQARHEKLAVIARAIVDGVVDWARARDH